MPAQSAAAEGGGERLGVPLSPLRRPTTGPSAKGTDSEGISESDYRPAQSMAAEGGGLTRRQGGGAGTECPVGVYTMAWSFGVSWKLSDTQQTSLNRSLAWQRKKARFVRREWLEIKD